MKIKLDSILKDQDGKPLRDGEQDVDLKLAITRALLSSFPDESKLSGADKVKRYELWKKVSDAKTEVELKAEEIALIKELIGKSFTTLVVGRAFDLIEGK